MVRDEELKETVLLVALDEEPEPKTVVRDEELKETVLLVALVEESTTVLDEESKTAVSPSSTLLIATLDTEPKTVVRDEELK